jgi:anti-sigma factor ChrR (cupin superfamily)
MEVCAMEPLRINDDFTKRAVVPGDRYVWVTSPEAGVERVMLDRIGGEVARATSIVRYAPGSRFAAHTHALGEEFLVLDGVFADERGAYPAGTYVRNPPDSRHAPFSEAGCTIFVKLRQFAEDDLKHVVIDTRNADWQPGRAPGVTVLPLHRHGTEQVRLVRYAPGTRFPAHDHPLGEEVLVIEGGIADELGNYGPGSWFRYPDGSAHTPFSDEGCLLYVKVGHLPAARTGDRR